MTLRDTPHRRWRRLILGVTTLATTVLIAACGSSASSTTGSTTSTTSTTASSTRTAFVKCMQEHGVTITPRAGGTGTPSTHPGTPPAGASGSGSSARQAAFKACGATGQHTKSGS